MTCTENYTKFKLISDFRNDQITNEIETNLKYWLDWCLLGIGAWGDVNIPTSGEYGNFHILRYVNDDAYTDGQVWEGVRKDWVWETGVEFNNLGDNPEPIQITGIQVNDVSYSGSDSTYGWHINYPLGRVIFDTAISITSDVQADYSYRYVQVYRADDAPWFRELQFASFKPNDGYFTQTDSGNWTIGGNHRVQLPAIVIEAVSRGNTAGYELGNAALIIYQDVLFHVIAENRYDRNNLIDILRQQSDKTIWLFNSNTMANSGVFPLDYRGMLIGTLMYPNFVAEDGYRYIKCTFENNNISAIESIHPNLYEGVVRSTLSLVLGTI